MDPKEQAFVALGASKEFELGKFFCTIIVGTAGFLLTAEKMNQTPDWTGLLLFGLAFLFAAMVVAVYMTLVSPFTPPSLLTKLIAKIDPRAWTCFWLWLIGTALGAAAVLPSS